MTDQNNTPPQFDSYKEAASHAVEKGYLWQAKRRPQIGRPIEAERVFTGEKRSVVAGGFIVYDHPSRRRPAYFVKRAIDNSGDKPLNAVEQFLEYCDQSDSDSNNTTSA